MAKKRIRKASNRVEQATRRTRSTLLKPFRDKRNTVDLSVGAKVAKGKKPRTWGGLNQ